MTASIAEPHRPGTASRRSLWRRRIGLADWLDGVGATGLWPLAGGSAVAWRQPGRISFREVDQAGNLVPDFGNEGVGTIRPLPPDADLTDSAKRRDHIYLAVGPIQQSRVTTTGSRSHHSPGTENLNLASVTGGWLILANPTMRWNPESEADPCFPPAGDGLRQGRP